ncbi:hypothetical protein PFICI_12055 [Pestalotiopsis fici W106-1]|uniref:Uncharacterized protein n=1 Tax=Pestalotiopsis fici (strain W106-1 / CGMCC3.15140) TaxID=1229662 RepID=W3WS49_PESFW|nr:uncharacterized protein PFICI_12055 [Pestalotiopsis fici W106-1]ETS76668.1 hypothetical protein PFICI_12055 [Pestalotiopsis fici W106-1]
MGIPMGIGIPRPIPGGPPLPMGNGPGGAPGHGAPGGIGGGPPVIGLGMCCPSTHSVSSISLPESDCPLEPLLDGDPDVAPEVVLFGLWSGQSLEPLQALEMSRESP